MKKTTKKGLNDNRPIHARRNLRTEEDRRRPAVTMNRVIAMQLHITNVAAAMVATSLHIVNDTRHHNTAIEAITAKITITQDRRSIPEMVQTVIKM
jgi:hypothetical protein